MKEKSKGYNTKRMIKNERKSKKRMGREVKQYIIVTLSWFSPWEVIFLITIMVKSSPYENDFSL